MSPTKAGTALFTIAVVSAVAGRLLGLLELLILAAIAFLAVLFSVVFGFLKKALAFILDS